VANANCNGCGTARLPVIEIRHRCKIFDLSKCDFLIINLIRSDCTHQFFEAIAEREERMLSLDQSTIANMTAALDFVCKKIPADRDSNELRKKIADELLRCARNGKLTLIELQQAGMKIVEERGKPAKSSRFGWWRK
jgi:hypothetical protein